MNRAEILKHIEENLADVLDLDDVTLTEESSAKDFEDWDSVNHVRLLISLERQFGFEFNTTEVGMLNNVGQLIDMISAKIG